MVEDVQSHKTAEEIPKQVVGHVSDCYIDNRYKHLCDNAFVGRRQSQVRGTLNIKCTVSQVVVALVVAILLGVTLIGGCQQRVEKNSPSKPAQETTANEVPAVAALQGDVAIVKDRAPDQAHTMIDVDYHCTKLWFAGKAENWPLAKFYWSEMVSHMR